MCSFTLLFTVFTLILPILIHVRMEENHLALKREAITLLHSHLQSTDTVPSYFTTEQGITINIIREEAFITGCADWEGAEKEICLYERAK
ncbi:hypothetical protein [Halobacillus salinarum]|uniref:hypothetical protein n=1 Tax=Halobacillus salinarum TaxID=2932257 RepID=UPI0037BF5C84